MCGDDAASIRATHVPEKVDSVKSYKFISLIAVRKMYGRRQRGFLTQKIFVVLLAFDTGVLVRGRNGLYLPINQSCIESHAAKSNTV